MTMTDSANGRIRIQITQQAKKEVCEFTVEVGEATNTDMELREQVAWASVDRMIEARNSRGFTTDA